MVKVGEEQARVSALQGGVSMVANVLASDPSLEVTASHVTVM